MTIRSTLAAIIAGCAWLALAIEFVISMRGSFAYGHGLAEALFLYFRFFSILTNIGIAVLMSVTVMRDLRHRPLPPAPLYAAAMVYIVVVGVTYEAMLRQQWSPHGIQFFSDMTIHDIVPTLSLVFWFGFAPKQGMAWHHAPAMLVYPAAYFAVTLIAGALGESYPYDFLDVSKYGYPAILETAVVFLTIFLVLGLGATAVAKYRRWAPPGRTRARAPTV